MQCQGVILLLLLLLKSRLTEERGYNCSDFHDLAGDPLEECPLAKFMLKDQLVECFDIASKLAAINSGSKILSFFFFIMYFVS